MEESIRLLQFIICENFKSFSKDTYTAEAIQSNLYVPSLPYSFNKHCIVTCWRKDKRFHKEVIEYSVENGPALRTPPMDVEPVTNSVLFRWHKHPFPSELVVDKPSLVSIKVILDWKVHFESYIMIEQG